MRSSGFLDDAFDINDGWESKDARVCMEPTVLEHVTVESPSDSYSRNESSPFDRASCAAANFL